MEKKSPRTRNKRVYNRIFRNANIIKYYTLRVTYTSYAMQYYCALQCKAYDMRLYLRILHNKSSCILCCKVFLWPSDVLAGYQRSAVVVAFISRKIIYIVTQLHENHSDNRGYQRF